MLSSIEIIHFGMYLISYQLGTFVGERYHVRDLLAESWSWLMREEVQAALYAYLGAFVSYLIGLEFGKWFARRYCDPPEHSLVKHSATQTATALSVPPSCSLFSYQRGLLTSWKQLMEQGTKNAKCDFNCVDPKLIIRKQ